MGGRTIRVFTAFSGYDSQLLALDRLKRAFPEFEYECVGWSEIDKHAIRAHNALFPDLADRNYGDISKIDWERVPDFDLFTMSSPCQDFSQAGLCRGGAEGSGTRSSLLWECRKAIIAKRPKYILFENVRNLVGAEFLPFFFKWQDELATYGYSNFASVLNARDYGVPQDRERVFMVSIHGFEGEYHFPRKLPPPRRFSDLLEGEVDIHYYLNDEAVALFISRNVSNDGVFEIVTREKEKSPIMDRQVAYYAIYRKGKIHNLRMDIEKDREVMYTLTASRPFFMIMEVRFDAGGQKYECRLRRLMEREAFRFMDVDEADIDTIQAAGIPSTGQYSLAGNSIVVACLYHIFRKMFVEPWNEEKQLTIW